MKKPKITVKQLLINDGYNILKTHVFRIYNDRHVTYNQSINGKLEYKKFIRIKKGHEYHSLYQNIKDSRVAYISNLARAVV